MKRKQISLDDAVGLTIEAVVFSHYSDNLMLIALSNAKFSVMHVSMGYDDDVCLNLDARWEVDDFATEELVKIFGVELVAEWQAENARRREVIDAAQKERRRLEFERLKKEFEGGQ